MLFYLNEQTTCETHEVYKCKRCIAGRMSRKGDMQYGDTNTYFTVMLIIRWNHYGQLEFNKIEDSLLKSTLNGVGSFVFQYRSHEAK